MFHSRHGMAIAPMDSEQQRLPLETGPTSIPDGYELTRPHPSQMNYSQSKVAIVFLGGSNTYTHTHTHKSRARTQEQEGIW